VAEEREPTAPEPPRTTVGELVTASIASAVAQMKDHRAGLRAGDDPDHVRKTRVALRRLRSNLRTFGDFLDEDALAPLLEELGELAGKLGGLRDREVLAARLEADAEHLAASEQPAAAQIVAQLRGQIATARDSLNAYLDSEAWPRLLSRLEAVAALPPLAESASRPAVEVAGSLARDPFSKLRKAVRRLPKKPADPQLHRVRILAKRSRYAAQAVEAVMGAPAHDFAAAAAELQTVLGEHQDAVTTEAWLESLLLLGPAAFVAGRLAGLERAAALGSRARWRAAWEALDAPELRAWMDEPEPGPEPDAGAPIGRHHLNF
jgi:CHAD domain-containing protein